MSYWKPDDPDVDDAPEGEAPPDYVMLDTITRTRVTWLWKDRIPFGKVTIIEGDPERAKSVLTLDLGSRVSTGSPMPDETGQLVLGQRAPAGVVVVCAEDDLADTVIPRLLAHHADLSRIASVPLARDEHGHLKPLILPEDQDRLEVAMRKVAAKLVVIDPITAYLSESINTTTTRASAGPRPPSPTSPSAPAPPSCWCATSTSPVS
jgi:hypothetical protein